MIDFRNFETFSCAAENMSLSEAARRLHVSQPTVSHRIKVLEREIGAPLFIRGNLGLQLTETGRFVLPWVQRLIHDSNDLAQMLASMQKEIVGELRIACSTTVGKYVLPQLASRFCLNYPDIRARILACRPERAALELLQGEAHIGVVSSEVADQSLEAQEFFRDTITLIVPASHPWAARASIEPPELLGEPIILREESSGTRRVLLAELSKHDISLDDLKIFIEIGNAEAIVRTVAAGYGISFVSSQASICLIERGDIVAVPVDGLSLRRTIYMLRKRNSSPHRPRDVFWGFIHDPGNADILNLASCRPRQPEN